LLSPIVVRTTLPRLTPRRPRRRMSRSTVQRATAAFPVHLFPDLVRTIDLQVGVPDPLDVRHQGLVALDAGAAFMRLTPAPWRQ
jgi:hypothetical protein